MNGMLAIGTMLVHHSWPLKIRRMASKGNLELMG
jgi:hypothetical protein